jgi:hypothetical protein
VNDVVSSRLTRCIADAQVKLAENKAESGSGLPCGLALFH